MTAVSYVRQYATVYVNIHTDVHIMAIRKLSQRALFRNFRIRKSKSVRIAIYGCIIDDVPSAGYSPLVKWRFELEVTQLVLPQPIARSGGPHHQTGVCNMGETLVL